MKFKIFATLAATIMTFLNLKEIPVENGKVKFEEDDESKLKDELGESEFQKVLDAFNKEIAESTKVKGISAQVKKLLKETNATQEELENLARDGLEDDDPDGKEEDPDKALEKNMKLLQTKIKEQNEAIQKLLEGAEDDVPIEKIKGKMVQKEIKHSATHLLGSNKAYDSFDGRNWNRLAANATTVATDFSDDSYIDKLNGDLSLFYRENPDMIESLHRDNFGLPSQWDRQTNVVDIITSGTIVSAEISQARKLPWAPKNKQAIKPEEGKIYPISIDIEFIGHLLSVIEASWIKQYNKEGSQAYKWSFVRFLVSELDKQARTEDRIASIKAVYVATPDDATKPGRMINRQNGLLYHLWKARDIDKKYRPFDIGVPTTANIVDYVDAMIESLPQDVRNQQGLELGMSPYWRKAYRKRYRQIHGLETDFNGEPEYPKDYPNIIFQPLVDLEGLDIMYITFSNNIQILENIPKEKSMYKFEALLRKIYVFADYKLGIRFKHIGNKVKDGDPDEFKVQTVWSNNVPVFKDDFFVPVFDDTTGEVNFDFNRLQVDDAWKTDITSVSGIVPGQLYRIQGNTNLAAAKNVVDNAVFELAGDASFNLQSGGTLTLYAKDATTLKEISRTAAPPAAPEESAVYSTDTVDADLGFEFVSEHLATTAITGVVNGVENKEITLYGNDGAGINVTLSTTGNIVVTAAATLATSADYIKLVKVADKWYEVERVIE